MSRPYIISSSLVWMESMNMMRYHSCNYGILNDKEIPEDVTKIILVTFLKTVDFAFNY